MKKYFKRFTSHSDYETFKASNEYIMPNVSLCADGIHYDKLKIITFIIDDVQYQALEGMTWGDWINSGYNIDNTFDTRFGVGKYFIVIKNNRNYYITLNNLQIYTTQIISSNTNYIIEYYFSEPE